MLINQKLNNFLKYLKYILILSFVLLLFTSSNQLDNNKQKVKETLQLNTNTSIVNTNNTFKKQTPLKKKYLKIYYKIYLFLIF